MPWISMKADFTFFTLKMIVRHTFRESFVMSFLFGLCPLRAFAGMQVSLETINVDEVCILDVRMPNGPFILSTGTTSKSVASTIPTWGVSNFFSYIFLSQTVVVPRSPKKKRKPLHIPDVSMDRTFADSVALLVWIVYGPGLLELFSPRDGRKKKVRSRSPSSRTIRRQCLL